jgi:phage terminase large subunit
MAYRLNPYLKDFWRARKRYKVLYGGRASGKSHDAAGIAVYLAANFTLKILCARQFQNRIDESVYTLLKDKIEDSPWRNDFQILKNSIVNKRTGSSFLFYGIARNLSEIKSTEGVDILWLEEAHYLTQDQWNVIEPTIRKKGSQIWIIWNPDEMMDFVYQYFVVDPPEDSIQRLFNWQLNPFLSDTMLKVIADAYRKDRKNAEHVYGGIPKTGGDKSVISLEYVLAAIDAHKKLGWKKEGKRVMGFDVADDGDDKNALVGCTGNIIDHVEEWDGLENEILKSSTRVYNAAKVYGAEVNFDSIGVGAHVGSKFAELNDSNNDGFILSYNPFNAGGSVLEPDGVYMELPHVKILNREHFSNIKAQMWDRVASMFRKTYEAVVLGVDHPFDELVSIDKDAIVAMVGEKTLNKMCQELAAPRKDIDGMGKFKVESKKDMKEKRGIKSPNIADAVIMSLIKPKRAPAGFFDL